MFQFFKNNIVPQSLFFIISIFFMKGRKFGNIENTIKKLNITPENALDLGCGESIANPFNAKELYGIDFREDKNKNIFYCNLGLENLPFEAEKFDCMSAFDLIEHIPRVHIVDNITINPFICLMDEIHRCLKPGGYFLSHTPAYPSVAAFQDPTHVNIITPNTFDYYFCGPTLYAKNYGFKGAFKVVKQGWKGHHLITLLQKN